MRLPEYIQKNNTQNDKLRAVHIAEASKKIRSKNSRKIWKDRTWRDEYG